MLGFFSNWLGRGILKRIICLVSTLICTHACMYVLGVVGRWAWCRYVCLGLGVSEKTCVGNLIDRVEATQVD